MKVISINSKETIGPQEIVFDLDETWSDEYQKRLSYGTLKFLGDGKLLKLTFPHADTDPVSEGTVINLNKKLANISASIADKAKRHQEMLLDLSNQINLPLK